MNQLIAEALEFRMPAFVVSARRVMDWRWPTRDLVRIHEARELHSKGDIELCQGKEKGYFVLYAIPRKVQRPNPR